MKHALYSGTKNIYGDMQTAAKSLIANSDVDKVWMLTEGDYDCWLPDFCEVVDVSGQEFFPKTSPSMRTSYSYLALMRAALALMPELADVDRILSLDVDTICVRSVSDVWDMPIDNCYFSAAQETATKIKNMLYCNTGVALYNLEKLRDGKAEEVIYALNERLYPNIEQDVFSFLCCGHIHDMPSEYNCTRFTNPTNIIRIEHFAGYKTEDWRKRSIVDEYRKMSWDSVLELHERAIKKAHNGK